MPGLARAVNVDPSLISRFRNGLRSPGGNQAVKQGLAAFLLERITQQNLMEELAVLCRITPGHLAGEEGLSLFSSWLYKNAPEQGATAIDQLLESLDSFSVRPADFSGLSPIQPAEDPPAVLLKRYRTSASSASVFERCRPLGRRALALL